MRSRSAAAYIAWMSAVAGVVACAVALVAHHDRTPTEPIGHSLVNNPIQGASHLVMGGGLVTFGFQVLSLNPGETPVQVTGVQLVNPKGMRLVGAHVAGPRRPVYQYIAVRGFPPHQYNLTSIPAVGATITRPRRGWELLLGIKVDPGQYAVTTGVRVEYRVVGQRLQEQQTFPTTFAACTTRSQLEGHGGGCPAPSEQHVN